MKFIYMTKLLLAPTVLEPRFTHTMVYLAVFEAFVSIHASNGVPAPFGDVVNSTLDHVELI